MKSKFFSIIASPFFDFGKLSSLTDERELVTRMEGGQELTARDEHFVDDQVQDVIQFEPKLWMQRRMLVGKVLKEFHARSVLDLGCGEGLLLGFLVGDTRIQLLKGVDLRADRLTLASQRLEPAPMDYQFEREAPLRIELYQGSICEVEKSLIGNAMDAAVCIEVIEHLLPEELEVFPFIVFGQYQLPLVILSTPNADYNVHFPSLRYGQENSIFRDADHKFEWTRREFEEWCHHIAFQFGYTVQFEGVGLHQGAVYDPQIGYCTQFALFKRIQDREERADNICSLSEHDSVWKPVQTIVYPHTDYSHLTPTEIQLEVEHALPSLLHWRGEEQGKTLSVCLADLWFVHRLRQVCHGDMEKLKSAVSLWPCLEHVDLACPFSFDGQDRITVCRAWKEERLRLGQEEEEPARERYLHEEPIEEPAEHGEQPMGDGGSWSDEQQSSDNRGHHLGGPYTFWREIEHWNATRMTDEPTTNPNLNPEEDNGWEE